MKQPRVRPGDDGNAADPLAIHADHPGWDRRPAGVVARLRTAAVLAVVIGVTTVVVRAVRAIRS